MKENEPEIGDVMVWHSNVSQQHIWREAFGSHFIVVGLSPYPGHPLVEPLDEYSLSVEAPPWTLHGITKDKFLTAVRKRRHDTHPGK